MDYWRVCKAKEGMGMSMDIKIVALELGIIVSLVIMALERDIRKRIVMYGIIVIGALLARGIGNG